MRFHQATSEQDTYPLKQIQTNVAYERRRSGFATDAEDGSDRAGSSVLLLPLPNKPYSTSNPPSPSSPVLRMTEFQEDINTRLRSMPQRSRYTRLLLFVTIEIIWLSFVLACHFHVFEVSFSDSDSDSALVLPGGLKIPLDRDALFKSSLSTLGIIIQLVAMLPMADIIVEVYSSEWSHVLTMEHGRLTHRTDRVSTLTSSFTDRALHLLDKRSSTRYRITFAVGVLSVLLQAIAPGALTVTLDTKAMETGLTIGALEAGRTRYTFALTPEDTEGNVMTELARKVLLQAARYEYVTWIQNSTVDFILNSNSILYGMPPRNLLGGTGGHVRYKSDGVQFRYSCQWLAPKYLGGDILSANWSFGGDMQGTMDYNARPIDASPKEVYGIWPLIITSGAGAQNGSFAWLAIGGGSDLSSGTTHMPIFLANATSERTTNSSGWLDLIANNTSNAEFLSSDATVLYCDPNMQLVAVSATLEGQHLRAEVLDGFDARIGNIDWEEASRMLGHSLNGMPWDSVPYDQPGSALHYSELSELAVSFFFTPNPVLPLVPRSLSELEKSLQEYVTAAGASAYLDGTLGNVTISAERLRPIQRLVCNLPSWGISLTLFLLIALPLGGVIFLEGKRMEDLVPLTLASVVAAVDTANPISPVPQR